MSKNRKRLMRSSLVMLIVAAVALSSATYAWFTSSKTASVTSIKFTAQAASGIQVSADKTNWMSTISADQIKTAQTSALRGELTAVSSAGTVSGGALQLYSGTLLANGKLETAAASVAAEGKGTAAGTAGYYKFDLWFKNEGGDNLDLYLCVADYSEEGTEVQKASTVAAGTTAKNTEYAVRIGTIAHNASSTPSDNNNGNACAIWEPNSTKHTQEAKDSRHVLDNTTGAPPTENPVAVDNQTLRYVGINAIKTGDDALTITEGAVPISGTDAKLVTVSTTSDMKVGTLTANQVVKVTFYIWLEGQDADCMNGISTGDVVANLNFYAKKST